MLYVFTCMSLCALCYLQEPLETKFSGTGVAGGNEQLCGCWKPNMALL